MKPTLPRSHPGLPPVLTRLIVWPRSWGDGPARPLAVPLLALQREGALGARLEGHRARAALAPTRLPRSARAVDDGAEVGPRPRARPRDDPRLDAHHRAPRAPATRAGALSGRRRRAPPGASPPATWSATASASLT